MKNYLILCLTALATLSSWAEPMRRVAPATVPALTGSNAVARLKADGQFDSLRAAITAARYGAKADAASGDVFAANPSHGFSSRFSPVGLRLTARTSDGTNAARHSSEWRLEAVGYGDALTTVPRGEVVSAGQRVELRRKAPAVVEWFENRPGGLEHGFTLTERPAGNSDGQALRVRIAVTGDLRPVAELGGQRLALRNAAGATVLTYDKLKVWDATGRPLTAVMETEAGRVLLTVLDAEAVYPLTIDPTFQQEAYLKASNTEFVDRFGYSVAVSGDTVVVGAYQESSSATGINGNQADNSSSQSGAAYVFTRSGTNWTQQAYLKASNTGANDRFGISVAISGNTVVVGARNESSNAVGVNGSQANNSTPGSGAAYVFTRSGTTWTQQAYLKASNTGLIDNFGYSVAVSGDTVVVGAYGEGSNATGVNGNQANDSSSQSGAAYVFTRSGTTWTQQAYLKASNTGESDWFGWSVAVSGDTVVVGAYSEDSNASGVNGNQSNNSAQLSGAAYVFTRSGTNWTQQAYLKASNSEGLDFFGYSVAVSGDTVVVGAYGESSDATGVNGNQANNSASSSGAAYVFTRSGTNWTQQAYLKASNAQTGDYFGWSVAISGDTLVVGAYLEESSATGVNGNQSDNSLRSGAAYVFRRTGTIWSRQIYLKASNTGANDGFGYSVAVSADTVVVGAYLEPSNATGVNGNQSNNSSFDSGAAYVFGPADPEIAIEQPVGFSLTNGTSTVFFSNQVNGSSGPPRVFNLRSLGTTPLIGISASLLGANPGDFILNTNLIPTSLGASLSTNFSISFAPTASGYRSAILRVTSNDEDEGVFDIALVGFGVQLSSFTNSTELTIPSLGNASVYPSTITVSNITGPVADIRVQFTGFSHVAPDDVDALLVSPGGQVVALMSDAGGAWTVYDLDLVFNDRATTLLPDNTVISGGTFRPSNFPGTEALPPGATGTIGTNIMDLATNGANGDWKLYIKDDSSSGGGGWLNAWSLTFEVLPTAEIDVVAGTNLVDGVSIVDFGTLPPGSNSLTRSFTIQNLGGTNLTGIQVTKGGANSGDFALGTNGLPSSLAAGASATFTVTFTPSGGGARTASLQILSSDSDEGVFDVALTGSGISALQAWRQLNFGTTSNTGLAADTADADLDGVTNVVEFAFGLDPNSNTSKLLPQGVVTNGNFVLSFTQPAGVGGVTYGVDWSPNPAPGPWTPVTDTGVPPAHLFSVPTNGNPTIYMRLKVSVSGQ